MLDPTYVYYILLLSHSQLVQFRMFDGELPSWVGPAQEKLKGWERAQRGARSSGARTRSTGDVALEADTDAVRGNDLPFFLHVSLVSYKV